MFYYLIQDVLCTSILPFEILIDVVCAADAQCIPQVIPAWRARVHQSEYEIFQRRC